MDDIFSLLPRYLPSTSILALKYTCRHLNRLIPDKAYLKCIAYEMFDQFKHTNRDLLCRLLHRLAEFGPQAKTCTLIDAQSMCSRFLVILEAYLDLATREANFRFSVHYAGCSCLGVGGFRLGPVAKDDPFRHASAAAIKLLLDHSARRGGAGGLDDYYLQSAWRHAARCGNVEVMQLVDSCGADLGKAEHSAWRDAAFGQTGGVGEEEGYMSQALGVAALNGHVGIVKFLLNAGAPVTGMDLVRSAVTANNEAVLELLLEKGADVNANEPIIEAATLGQEGMVAMLIAYGADLHVHQECALRKACEKGWVNIVKLLLKHGADVAVRNGQLLRDTCSVEVIAVLLDNGLSVHADNEAGLRGAVRNDSFKKAMFLLKRGAAVTSDILYATSNAKMMRLLFTHGRISEEVVAEAKSRAVVEQNLEMVRLIETRGRARVYEIASKLNFKRWGLRLY
ncbi:hypothetical protein HK104_009007 [Borealophlyctis nickersoniae]|nr:hypothetical protein HK104_009007 [Borealophlyctis nickersoniae]